VNKKGIFLTERKTHLPDSFKKRLALNITDCSSNFDNHYIVVVRDRIKGVLDLISHMRDYLNGLAQIISMSFLPDNLLINPAGGPVMVFGSSGQSKPFIMSQIKIGFGPIVGNKDFTMLVGAHCSRVNIKVWI